MSKKNMKTKDYVEIGVDAEDYYRIKEGEPYYYVPGYKQPRYYQRIAINRTVDAVAITPAATLGVFMKKPLAVTCLLFLCFPVRMGLWIFLAAILAGQIGKGRNHHR